jgi:hypothetical protein
MTFVRWTDEEDEKRKELDKVRLTESRRINWRPLNECNNDRSRKTHQAAWDPRTTQVKQ